MAITRSTFSFDDSLIIPRWQQKEHSPPLTLDPFIDQLPIKIGMSFNLLGTRIVSCQIHRGFLAQQLEKSLSYLDIFQSLNVMARLNQSSPIFAQLAYSIALEQLLHVEVTRELKDMRCFLMEFSRIFHHLQVIENTLIAIKHFNTANMASEALRLISPSHQLLGRIYDKITFPDQKIPCEELKNTISEVHNFTKEIENILSFDQIIRQALRKKAFITQNVASSYGLTGLFLRANRNLYDLRVQNALLGYSHLPTTELAEGGDAWARLCLRSREINASIEWIKKCALYNQDIEPLREERALDIMNFKEPFAFGEVDSPEGNLKVSIFIDSLKRPNFRIRTPAYFIAQALPHLLAESDLKDLPAILYSLGIKAEEIDK
jgi:NADH:ubiquinone oxidoreductase subunit D